MKILAVVPLAYDGTSYYRSYGIFPNLRKQLEAQGEALDIMTYQGAGWTWASLIQYDILYLQRPAFPDWLKLAKYCKDIGIKIWVDHDDNLFELPVYNRVVDTYTEPVKNSMLQYLKLADVVTVSTPAIQEYFLKLGIKSEVIPNALNTDLTKPVSEVNKVEAITQMCWRGSETHEADLYFHQDAIFEAATERSNAHWSFLGYNPWFITIRLNSSKFTYYKAEDIMLYWQNLLKIKPNVMFVPLFMDGLNAYKSNIAWIEATAAGAITIAPDWPEWRKPGIINYTSMEHFAELLKNGIEDYDERWEESMEFINNNLLLSIVNRKRIIILHYLMGRTKPLTVIWGKDKHLPDTMIE